MRKKRVNVPHRYFAVQLICGIVVGLLGSTVLVGWLLDITWFKSVASGFRAMNPVAAINFILFGCWLSFKSRHAFKYISYLTAVLLLVNSFVIGFKVGKLFYPTLFVIDEMLFADSIGQNKIAPAAVVNFLLLTCALAASCFRRTKKEFLFQSFVLATFAISAIYLCGYLFNFSSLIEASSVAPMPLHTCIGFLVLCYGLLFTYPDSGFMRPLLSKKLGGAMARRILPLLVITPIATGALRIWGQNLDLYNTELGVAIHVIVVAFLSFILSHYFAKKLNEIDAVRKNHENELVEKTNLLHQSEILLEQTAKIAKVGGWEITFPERKVIYTKEVYSIKEIDEEAEISFAESINSYTPESTEELKQLYRQALKDGQPFEVEAKLITAKNNEIWVKIKAQPIKDDRGNIIALSGTLQDIDETKKKEILLQQSIEIINEQNTRLMNFTHIVSHNLRTHAANIKSTLNLYETEESEAERALILRMTRQAADSLNQTIADLSEIVATQSASQQLKSRLYFEDVFTSAKTALEKDIKASQAIIQADFSACEQMDYVPAYLESIFHNFLSNAIKYRRPDVQPEIKIVTCVENGKVAMTFSDNGLGIDLAKYKEKLFGMYKTFHSHPDSTGVGLFLTKNQVESLGGNILVDSEVNVGTTFKILF